MERRDYTALRTKILDPDLKFGDGTYRTICTNHVQWICSCTHNLVYQGSALQHRQSFAFQKVHLCAEVQVTVKIYKRLRTTPHRQFFIFTTAKSHLNFHAQHSHGGIYEETIMGF